MFRVLVAEIDTSSAVPVASLNHDTLWLDIEGGVLLLGGRLLVTVIAGVNFDFYLRVEAAVDVRGRVKGCRFEGAVVARGG